MTLFHKSSLFVPLLVVVFAGCDFGPSPVNEPSVRVAPQAVSNRRGAVKSVKDRGRTAPVPTPAPEVPK